MDDLITQMFKTAKYAGIKIIGDDKCCRLLAWLYVYGGGYEGVTFDKKLNHAIKYAQKRMNAYGGNKPNADLIPTFQNYYKSITDYKNPPEWVLNLEREYNIKINTR